MKVTKNCIFRTKGEFCSRDGSVPSLCRSKHSLSTQKERETQAAVTSSF